MRKRSCHTSSPCERPFWLGGTAILSSGSTVLLPPPERVPWQHAVSKQESDSSMGRNTDNPLSIQQQPVHVLHSFSSTTHPSSPVTGTSHSLSQGVRSMGAMIHTSYKIFLSQTGFCVDVGYSRYHTCRATGTQAPNSDFWMIHT
jgi:hypothetical protein